MIDGPLPSKEARLLKALGHPVRLRIAIDLLSRESCVGEIWSVHGIAQAEASRHLALLRKVKAVRCVRNGRQICYRLEDGLVRRLVRALASPVD